MLRQLVRAVHYARFWQQAGAHGLALRFRVYPSLRHGHAWATYLSDMAFNLAPDADAYRNPDPEVEEAIACIEALARVPQQVVKWGHAPVQLGWPSLYAAYYGTVVPGCIAAAGQPVPTSARSAWQGICVSLRRKLRKKPDYYPEAHD